jgi:MoxR-like ATPase
MMLETVLSKLPRKVSQIEQAEFERAGVEVKVLRIRFTGLNEPGYVISDDNGTRFYHCCEASAKGGNCTHITYAQAVALKSRLQMSKTYHAQDPSDYEELIKDVEGYVDVSLEFNVVPPEPDATGTGASASTSSASEANPGIVMNVATPISNKRNWKDGYNEILEYLRSEDFPASMIVEIRALRESIFDTVQLTSLATEPAKPDLPYTGPYIRRAFRHILNGKDLILIGDKGSGKDTLINTIAWVLGLPVYLQPGNANETKESIVGDRSFAKGEVFFDLSPFATAVKYGGISNYTEINMIPGQITAVFHPVLDENRQLPTLKGAIKRHPHHIFLGSMNHGEQYVGVSEMNAALMDRFAVLNLPYTLEFRDLLTRKTGLTDRNALNFLEEVKKQIDELIATENSGHRSKTIRGYIDAAVHFNKFGVSLDTKVEAIEDFIVNKTEDRDERFIIRDRLRQSVFPDLPKTQEEEDYWNGKS